MNICKIEITDPAFEQFLALPQRIYRDDPHHRVRPPEETRALLDTQTNPCWKHARRALFLLERDGEAIGRIAAIQDSEIDRQHHQSDGFFGFFECIDDPVAARELTDAASRWLVEHGGGAAMRGPCTPLPDFYNFGILVEGFQERQVTGEAFNPEYYPSLIEGCGFQKEDDHYSFRNELDGNTVFEKMMQRLEHVLEKHGHGASLRPFDVTNFHRDAAIVCEVINRSFESESFYSMVDVETQEFMLRNIAPLDEMHWFRIMEENGRPVGVNLSAPNGDDLLFGETISGIRVENFGVLPEYQRSFAASSLYYDGWDQIRRAGYKNVYISYVHEKNAAMLRMSTSMGCRRTKTHRIYCKRL